MRFASKPGDSASGACPTRPHRRQRLPAARSRAADRHALVTPEGPHRLVRVSHLLVPQLDSSWSTRPGHELPRRHSSCYPQPFKHPCRRLSSPATGATTATSSRSSARAFLAGDPRSLTRRTRPTRIGRGAGAPSARWLPRQPSTRNQATIESSRRRVH